MPLVAVKEQITLALVELLEDIEEGVEYPIDIEQVVRPKRSFPGDDEIGDRWVTVEQQEMDTEEPSYGTAEDRTQSYWVTGWLAVSDRNTQPVDKRLNEFEATIEKAIRNATRTNGKVLGGLADNIRVTGSEPEPRSAFEGIRLTVDVTYSSDDPFGE